MLLYEQILYDNMVDFIKGLNVSEGEKELWSTAASQFRLPYWDWARKQPYTQDYGIPQICTQPTWPVIQPGTNGKTILIENPLTGFSNPKRNSQNQRVPMGDKLMGANAIKDDGTLPWSQCIGTSRYGIVADVPPSIWVNGVNNWQYSNAAIANPPWYDGHPPPLQSSTFSDAVSRMFTPNYFDSWEAFSSTAHNNPRRNTNYMSLEYIHNIIHNGTGGLYLSKTDIPESPVGFTGLGIGHMSDPTVASFDPIFWLHHCNVDRLCALWQVLNWSMWFNNPSEGDPASSDPLLPFHSDTQKSNWTSDKCRDWRNANYQYDDLKGMPPGTPTPEYQATLRSRIKALYPSTSAAVARSPGFTLQNNTFHDYIINVVYDRYALNGKAYSILFYIGEPTVPFSAAKTDPHYLGSVYTFGAPVLSADGQTTCDNCGRQKAAKKLSKAQIPLTLPLIRRVQPISTGAFGIPATPLGPLDPNAVERVLDVGLVWHFIELGGREADASEFPSTEIAVLRGEGQHPVEDHIMPRYGRYKKLRLATENKRLGFGHRVGPNDLIGDDPDA
ncbi:MAG: hypothetical protein LQ351_007874 [Letrouitia transgressa]|nr:MAG: hypothetical protein LQ351_007874 [Letrouitia transgressa]